jgi:hypothetical protein
MNDSVNSVTRVRSLIAKLCILGMLSAFVIVVPVVRADYWENCDTCSAENHCESAHFWVEVWYADQQRCVPECDTEKSNRDTSCESTKDSQEQAAPDECRNTQTGEVDQTCLSQRMNDIQTQYFNCTQSSEWLYNGCVQECDAQFQDPPEDCTCYYASCAHGCCQ